MTATDSTTRETTPRTCPGVTWLTGNRKPLTLVAIVVARNSAVQLSSRCLLSSPHSTTKPEIGIPADLDKVEAELEQLARPQNDAPKAAEPDAKQLHSST